MKRCIVALTAGVVCLAWLLTPPVAAQEAPPVVAEAGEEDIPGLTLETDAAATGAELTEEERAEKLRLMINLELIDLDRLRQAVEQRIPRETISLTLEDAIHMALARNQDIQAVEYEPMKAEGDIMAARGEFDPVLSASTTYLQAGQSVPSDVRAFSGISSIKTHRTTGQAAVGGRLVTGTQYQLAFNAAREVSTYSNFREEWDGRLTLSLTQPLLRGFGVGVNRTRVRVAQATRGITVEQLRQTVMTTATETIRAYWDLVGALETLRVREESLANAERLLQINERRFEIGAAAAIEVLQSKAGVAGRQSELIAARSSAADREDALKRLLMLQDDQGFAQFRVIPIDRPYVAETDWDEVAEFEPAVEASLARAVELRPELEMARLDIETATLQRRRVRNDLLPQFDVGGTLSTGGRDSERDAMLRGVRDRDDYSYTVTIQGSVPIGNRAGRGAYHRSEMELRQAEHRYQQRMQDVTLDIRLAARNVITSQILVESNRQARLLQEANVIAEERRLQLGVTTSYRVLQVQEDLTAAQTQEVQALVSYQQARTNLLLAEGAILEAYGLALDVPQSQPMGYFESLWPF